MSPPSLLYKIKGPTINLIMTINRHDHWPGPSYLRDLRAPGRVCWSMQSVQSLAPRFSSASLFIIIIIKQCAQPPSPIPPDKNHPQISKPSHRHIPNDQKTCFQLFDLTATNIVGKYPGKSGLNMLLHLVSKVLAQKLKYFSLPANCCLVLMANCC